LVAEAVEEDSLADRLEAAFPAVVVRAVPGDWGHPRIPSQNTPLM